jgi:flagellar hook assembly protein FlgD
VIPWPFIITAGMYNEAGELVKVLDNSPASAMFTNVLIDVPGNTDNSVIGNDKILNIIIPGVEIPATLGQGYTTFYWNETNAQAQVVDPGVYYIKVQETDAYGHVNVVIKEITVVISEQYVQMTIFNSAGEIVKVVTDYAAAIPSNIDLSGIGDTLIIQKTGPPMQLKYDSAGDFLTWDGKNDQGLVVSSGDYEVQVTIKTAQGITISATKTVILLREDKLYLDKFEVWPNPFTAASGTNSILFKWTTQDAGETGDVTIRVYNIAGDLAKEIKSTIQAGSYSWNLLTSANNLISRGLYVAVLYSKNDQGYTQIKTVKFAVASYK